MHDRPPFPPFAEPDFERPPDAMAAKITALLDKAESTPFEAEAEAFLAKAQELMSRHAIDEAMLDGARAKPNEIISIDLLVTNPYASAKGVLLSAVARPNRCRVVSIDRPGRGELCTVVGHRTDVDHTRTLYLSLSHQAVRFMLEANAPAGAGVRRFRHAFLLAYGTRIGERLQEARLMAEAAAEVERDVRSGEPSVGVVLANREVEVDRAFTKQFPQVRFRRVSSSSGAGYAQGRSAANRSSLGGRGVSGGQASLPHG